MKRGNKLEPSLFQAWHVMLLPLVMACIIDVDEVVCDTHTHKKRKRKERRRKNPTSEKERQSVTF